MKASETRRAYSRLKRKLLLDRGSRWEQDTHHDLEELARFLVNGTPA